MSAIGQQKAEDPVRDLKESSQGTITMKQESVDLKSVENAVSNQNGTNGGDSTINDFIKTEGEASNTENSFIQRSLQLTPSSTPSSSSPITPFAPNLGSLSSLLTPEEQTAAYKKANILALSALAKRGGPNTKDMFASQQKLQEFLTSLITLAGQKGSQLKVTVQMLVQNLVTGQINEEEFASRIESDLHSQHQPSLLPFLKSSVPHLKARLQLQQAIMKELLQRTLSEKKNTSVTTTPSTSTVPLTTATTVTTGPLTTGPLTTDPLTSTSTSSISASESLTNIPKSTTSSAGQLALPQQSSSLPSVRTSSSVVSVSSSGTKPVVIGTSVPGLNSNSSSQLIPAQVLNPVNLETLSRQLPKELRDQIAKLPRDQQIFVYSHHFKKLQLLKEQQMKQQQQQQQQQQQVVSAKVVRERQQKLVQEQQVPLVVGVVKPVTPLKTAPTNVTDMKKAGFASMKLIPGQVGVTIVNTSPAASGKRKGKAKESGQDVEDEEEVGMDILDEVGVNLQEETAQFLPQTVSDSGVSRSCKDTVFLNLSNLRRKVEAIMRVNGVTEVSDEMLVVLSHATQERMKDVIEKLTEISRHRMEVLKDDSNYKLQSEVRGQLRVLETIDRIVHKRKQEREHEQTLRAAKSRSKGADPEKTAKIREEAKQIQMDEAARIRNAMANETALAAIGRKRPLPPSTGTSGGGGASSHAGPLEGSSNSMTSSLFAPLASTRAPKRHVTSRDLMFYMEQERETRKSLGLYKLLLK